MNTYTLQTPLSTTRFKCITCKLGNMRKADKWVLYPQGDNKDEIIIQCDKRISKVNLSTGNAILSNGKGGHNGFMHLNKILGAVDIVVPNDILEQLRTLVAQ